MAKELLDELDPSDPRAQRSRRDLQRIHRVMGTVDILSRSLNRFQFASVPRSILELGAGDGTLLLRLAHAMMPRWKAVDLFLLDRHDLVSPGTRAAYREIGWTVSVLAADVSTWIEDPKAPKVDLCLANLFLHHFDALELQRLLGAVAMRSSSFIACEPHRDRMSWLASLGIGLLGTNAITRDDAVKSVRAGFRDRELSALWGPTAGEWAVHEYSAGAFSHCFIAEKS